LKNKLILEFRRKKYRCFYSSLMLLAYSWTPLFLMNFKFRRIYFKIVVSPGIMRKKEKIFKI